MAGGRDGQLVGFGACQSLRSESDQRPAADKFNRPDSEISAESDTPRSAGMEVDRDGPPHTSRAHSMSRVIAQTAGIITVTHRTPGAVLSELPGYGRLP